ncbi:MAG TPA: CAP domain-containing protein [Polyangiaceae bacterium]|nr:CAP domain-containing protein [Polyangiaceae bacterium]
MFSSRRPGSSIAFVFLLAACSSPSESSQGTGGANSGGSANNGGSADAQGGAPPSGGAPANGGTNPSGGIASGGTDANGGAKSSGGASNGGAKSSGGAATGGGASSSGGAKSSGGASTTGGTAGNASGGSSSAGAPAGAAELCTRWKSDRMNMKEDAWNGNAASCDAGDMTAASRDTVLRLVNLYRAIAQLPAVTFDPTRNQQDQACALMMQANGTIDHEPPDTWKCYSADGAKAAGNSNLSSTSAVAGVDGYMLDPGNATTLGHRRWILSNSLGPIGVGSTGKYSCMWTLGGTGKAGKPWMAWPSAGVFPLEAFGGPRQTIDSTGWSLQSDSINLSGAKVAVTFNGVSQPVTVTQLDPNYGSRYAIRFNPMGWTSAVGAYHVSVTGIPTAIEYDVNVVACTP